MFSFVSRSVIRAAQTAFNCMRNQRECADRRVGDMFAMTFERMQRSALRSSHNCSIDISGEQRPTVSTFHQAPSSSERNGDGPLTVLAAAATVVALVPTLARN
jgi:hypothetical protein